MIVSNLAYAGLVPPKPTGRVAVKLGGQLRGLTRYDNLALGPKPLRRLIDQLATHQVLSLKYSTTCGEVSSVAPTQWLLGYYGRV